MDFEDAFRVANTAVLAKTKRNLKDLEATILSGAWEGKSYYEIADAYGYSAQYLTQDVGSQLWKLLSEALGEKVSKTNFKSALERQWRLQQTADNDPLEPKPSNSEETTIPPHVVAPKEVITDQRQDWGEAVDVSLFYGRTTELTTLEQWIVHDRCRLISILGIGGIGKTALSVRSAEKIQHEFDYLIWRSLLHAPPVEKMLATLIQILSGQEKTYLPETISDKVSVLINYLRSSRCLLVLDNFESILHSGEQFGRYRSGYEGYGELLRRVGETHHQSCLVLTSREKPEEVALLEGEISSIRSLQLAGLKEVDGQEILKVKSLVGTEDERRRLIEYYGGNPLELKIVSTSIRDLFGGNIADFLEQGITVFNGVRNLLDQQFNRLSDLEKQIMYWLAINREPISSLELQEDIVTVVSRPRLLEAIEFLRRRSLVERCSAGFTQQTVVMDYITEIFLEQIFEEIKTEQISLLMSHALIKAETKDYIRERQNNLILEHVIDKLIINFVSQKNIEKKLNQLLWKIREQFYSLPGYASGNIINLLVKLKINLTGYDFSNLTIWQAFLQNINLRHVNLANSDLAKSVFAEKLGGILSIAFSPDGKLLVTSDTNGEIHLWQIKNGKQIVICRGSTNWTFSVAFSPLGNILASGNLDKTVKLWDVSDGKCLKTLTGHTSYVHAIAFSPDGQTLVSSSYDQTIKLWDISDGKCLKTLTGHTSYIQTLAFAPQRYMNSSESYTLASGSQDNTIMLWDVGTGKCLNTLQGHSSCVSSVAFSPEGQILASGSDDHTVKLWDVDTGKCLNTLQGHSSWVSSVAFSPEGQILASGSDDHTVKLWDVDTGKCLNTLQGHSNWVSSVAFSPEGHILASGSHDQAVKLWDIHTSQSLKTLQGHTNRIFSVAFAPQCCGKSPDRYTLVSGSEDCNVRLWDVDTAQCLKTLQTHTSRVLSVSVSPLGLILASASEDSTIKLWGYSHRSMSRNLTRTHESGSVSCF